MPLIQKIPIKPVFNHKRQKRTDADDLPGMAKQIRNEDLTMTKNGRRTNESVLTDQLDRSSIELLTKPSMKTEKPAQKKKVNGNKQIFEQSIVLPSKPKSQEKERMTVQISKDTIERVKDCVYWNRLTVAQFVEEALKAALLKAEKENGKSFDRRRSELKPGRPTK